MDPIHFIAYGNTLEEASEHLRVWLEGKTFTFFRVDTLFSRNTYEPAGRWYQIFVITDATGPENDLNGLLNFKL